MNVYPVSDLNNTTFYLLSSYLYSSLGDNERDLNIVAPEQISLSTAPKLTEIHIGNYDSEKVNESLSSLTFESNDLLEELYLCNCTNLSQTLDLKNSPSLKLLDARNSGLTSVSIANNAPI